ncbi:CGNR zinc finger domain-containing protein [Actinomadura rubrobrunea]|nr:CGNR zinc finger domain-containing protein [Actinomadura rubrobrunea]
MAGPEGQGGRPRARRVTRKMRDLRFDAGAPSLNLLATVGRRGDRPVERLDGTERLAEWLRRMGLPVSAAQVDADLLDRIRALREAMHAVVAAVIDERVPAPDAVAAVNAAAARDAPARRVEVRDGRVQVRWPPDALSGTAAMALLARDLLDRLGDEEWRARLRVCAADDCRMIFVDTSQGRRRQWCSMEYCGNRAKAAKHRARAQED